MTTIDFTQANDDLLELVETPTRPRPGRGRRRTAALLPDLLRDPPSGDRRGPDARADRGREADHHQHRHRAWRGRPGALLPPVHHRGTAPGQAPLGLHASAFTTTEDMSDAIDHAEDLLLEAKEKIILTYLGEY